MIQCFHAFISAFQKTFGLTLLLVQELDLDDGREMLLKKTVFLGGLFLDRIRGPAQGPFKLLAKNKEKRHQRENHHGQPRIERKHGAHDEDGLEGRLQNKRN